MQLLEIGKIIKTKGLDGTLKVLLFSNNVEDILSVKTFFINNEQFTVKRSYFANGCIFISFNEINSIEKAEKYISLNLFVAEKDIAKLEENEKFVKDLINNEVYLTNGEKIGKLVNVENYGASDIAIINTRRNEIMVPIVDGLIESFEGDKIIFNEKMFKEMTEEFTDEN